MKTLRRLPFLEWVKDRSLATPAVLLLLGGLFGITPAGAETFDEDFSTTTYEDAVNTSADWNTVAGELRLPPFSPSVLATYNSPNRAEHAVRHGNLLYVGDLNFTTPVLDISNPSSPTLLGTNPGSVDVYVAGDLAYHAFGPSGLNIVDISTPVGSPIIGTLNTPDFALGVVVSGNVAYVCDRFGGLITVDVGDPTSPTILGTFATGYARAVEVSGNIACLADQNFGLKVLDVTDPANPDSIGAFALPNGAYDVDLDGQRVYVASFVDGPIIFDISDPTNPILMDSYATGIATSGVRVSGDRLFVGDYSAGTKVFDISDPTNMTLIASIPTPDFTYGVLPVDGLLYSGDRIAGLRVLRVAVPMPPTLVADFDSPGVGYEVVVAGGRAYAASGDRVTILDVDDPASPSVLGSVLLNAAFTITISGEHAYVASGTHGMTVVDVSDPTAPAIVGSYVTPASAVDVAISGDLAFVTDGDSLHVLDVSDPAMPAPVSSYPANIATNIVVDGDRVLVGDVFTGTLIIDVSTPATPTLIGTAFGLTADIAVDGDYLYTTGSNGHTLRVFDITDPSTPVTLATINAGGSAQGLAVVGDRVFVSNQGEGLQVFDVTDPTNPTLVTSHPTTTQNQAGLAVAGRHLYLTALDGADLEVYQVYNDSVDVTSNAGQSLTVNALDHTILGARLSSTETGGVSWEVAADGASWQPIAADGSWTPMTVSGNDFRWRNTLTWTDGQPVVSDLTLDWLYEFAAIDAITDVPNDQGGRVYMTFDRSWYDDVAEMTNPVTQYGVYRRVDDGARLAPGASAPKEHEAPLLEGTPTRWIEGVQYAEGSTQRGSSAFPPGTWALVATVPATQSDAYLAEVATVADSSGSGTNEAVYVLSTHTTIPSVWFVSYPDSGYSVDNLAPEPPANLAFGQPDELEWSIAPENDFERHAVYGSGTLVFDETATLLGYTTGTTFDVSSDAYPVYHVTTEDHAGNVSDPSSLSNPLISTPEEVGAPGVFALHAARPNPTRSGTAIGFDVPAAEKVRVRVFDAAGRQVAELADRSYQAGRHEVRWQGTDSAGRRVAPGTYFVRVTTESATASGRIVVMR